MSDRLCAVFGTAFKCTLVVGFAYEKHVVVVCDVMQSAESLAVVRRLLLPSAVYDPTRALRDRTHMTRCRNM
jgi:hypothetical protein